MSGTNTVFTRHTDSHDCTLGTQAIHRQVWPEQLAWEATLAALGGLLSDPEGGIDGMAELAVKVGRATAEVFCADNQVGERNQP